MIWNKFNDILGNIKDKIVDIYDKIVELPTNILNGLKDIFIPKTDNIDSMFDNAMQSIRSKFGFQEFNLNALTNTSSSPTDIEDNYSFNGIGNLKLKFFDTKYLIKGVEYFRPFIRGFVVLMLIFYNIKMFLGFIGHDIGIRQKEVKEE